MQHIVFVAVLGYLLRGTIAPDATDIMIQVLSIAPVAVTPPRRASAQEAPMSRPAKIG